MSANGCEGRGPQGGPTSKARRFGLFSAALAGVLLLVSAGVAQAGVIARFETRDIPRGTSELGRLLAQDGHYRMDRLRGEEPLASVLIVGGKTYVIDHVKKFWSQVDDAALRQMEADLQASANAFDQRIATMDDTQRQALLTNIGDGKRPGPGVRKVEDTGEQAEKQGFPSRLYRVTVDGTKVREIWATPWSKVVGAAELGSAQSAMEAYYQRLTSVFAGIRSDLLGISLYDSPENPFADFGKIDGFAVVTRNFSEGRSLAETVLLEVQEQKIDGKEFELPADYQQKAMNQ